MTSGNWEVEFYELTSGRCPTREFLDSLQAKGRVFAQRALERLERFGIKKKTGPVPPAEIDRAIAHRVAYFERNEGG